MTDDGSLYVQPYDERHLAGVVALCAEQGWRSYADHPDVAHRTYTAAGATSAVAVRSGEVIGFATVLGDGELQGYLVQLVVDPNWQRRGIARRLVNDVTRRSGVQRLDLLTDEAQDFYASLPHRTMDGFRLYPLA